MRTHAPDSTADKIVAAALEVLAERGFKGASTRAIATRAGVNESTVFRTFGSKRDLVVAALKTVTRPLFQVVGPPSGDVARDLLGIARAYEGVLMSLRGVVVQTFPELMRDPELRQKGIGDHLDVFSERLVAFFRACQENGTLRTDEAPEQMALSFVGPIYTRSMWVHAWGASGAFDAAGHVRSFLEGHRPKNPDQA